MKTKRIWSIYFSPTGTTEKIVNAVAKSISHELGIESFIYDFSLPAAREGFPELTEEDLVVFGMPTYAGRLPNLLLPYLDTIQGRDALAVPIVTFGNRSFDNSLIELRNILESKGFHTISAGAFSCEHSFSYKLGAKRPDESDLEEAKALGSITSKSVISGDYSSPVEVEGDASAGYYQPRDRHGVFIDIRKVKPKTNENCNNCGLCALSCPMGAIDLNDPSNVLGKCIKCCRCYKKCPQNAKYFDDPGYIYHKEELEEMYSSPRKENRVFY